MELWNLFLFIGLTLGAPFSYEKNYFSPLVKRAQETIMFGNQQNAPKIKRGDSSVPILPDDNGSVRALPPQDVSETGMSPEENSEIEEIISVDEQEIPDILKALNNKVSDSEVENEAQMDEEEEVPLAEEGEHIDGQNGNIGAMEIPEQTDEMLTSGEKLLASSEGDREMKPTVDINSDEESAEESDYDDYMWRWLEVLPANRDSPDYPDSSYDGYYHKYRPYQPQLRNMQAPMLKSGTTRETEVKRSHRTKRDLLFPEDETNPYYLNPADVSEAIYGETPLQYGESPDTLSELNDPYYELLETEDPAFDEVLEEEEYENIKPIVYQGQPGYFVPAKRSDLLSFVPGNKRDQYFYPFSEEPQTHWGAFIPSKRDYTDSYTNLVRLARKLAMKESPREFKGYREYSWE